jgi:hypothetical protein
MAYVIDPDDRRAGLAVLSRYSERMESLITRLAEKSDMHGVARDYKALKDDLKEDYERLTRKESQGQASHVEVAFVSPALHEASTRLRPATNSNQYNSRWLDAIYSAKIDIDSLLRQLES